MCVHEVFLIETRNNLTTLYWLSNLDGGTLTNSLSGYHYGL